MKPPLTKGINMTKKRQNPLNTLAEAVGTAIVAVALVPVLIVQAVVSQ